LETKIKELETNAALLVSVKSDLTKMEKRNKILETKNEELEQKRVLMAGLIADLQKMDNKQKRLETAIEKLELLPMALTVGVGVGAVVGFFCFGRWRGI